MEIIPGKEARIVAVIKHDPDGIITNRLDGLHQHIALARYGDALVGRVALNLRTRARDAQKFSCIVKAAAILKTDTQRVFIAIEPDFFWPDCFVLNHDSLHGYAYGEFGALVFRYSNPFRQTVLHALNGSGP